MLPIILNVRAPTLKRADQTVLREANVSEVSLVYSAAGISKYKPHIYVSKTPTSDATFHRATE